MKATLLYTLARLGVFVVLFFVVSLTHLSVYLSAAIAAVLALLVSYIFFGRLRRGVADSIVRRRAVPERDDDADLEDSLLDGPPLDGSAVAAPSAGTVLNGGPVLNGGAPAQAPRPAARRTAPPAEDD